MNYFYTFIKADQSITVSGSGNDPKDIQDIKWTSSPGAAGVLKQMDDIKSVYSPTIGFVSVDEHNNNFYVHIAKFNNIYKDGWRFENSNIPAPVSNTVEKAKTKQRVLVPASKHHKAYYRLQDVGKGPTVEANNIWDMTAKEFNVLMGSTKSEVREAYIYKFRSSEHEPHLDLQRLLTIMPEFMGEMFTPDPASMFDVGYDLHEMAVTDALDYYTVSPRVLKNYPDLAKRHNIDISDEAVAAAPPLPDEPTALHDMGRDQYNDIIAGVRKDYDRSPESVSNADLEREFADELKAVDKAAKTRKQVYDNMPQHMQLGCTPDTMTQKVHYEGIILAAKNNKDIPNAVKEQYPMIFTDIPINFKPTSDSNTCNAVNDVLTVIRDKMGDINYATGDPDDRMAYRSLLTTTIKGLIDATGENVPTCFMGMEPEEEAAVSESVDKLSNFLGPDLVEQMKASGYETGIIYNKFEDRSYCNHGNITLSEKCIRVSRYSRSGSITVDDDTIMHEYGHVIEHYAPGIQSECYDFLSKRTEGERTVQLSDAIVSGGYDADEHTYIDNFRSAYIGKQYSDRSTEILSMGMGYLSNDWETVELMMADPEYLGFIIATAAGKVGLSVNEEIDKAESDKYSYTYIKGDEFIRVSRSTDPHDLTDAEWTSSPGAAAVLEQLNSINTIHTHTFGLVAVNDYKDNIYVQIEKFNTIYKNGWRFGATNLPEYGMAKSEVLAKGKTKKNVYVKGSGKRKPYWRVQEVGREEIDPKKIENIWDITLDHFQRLVSGDKQLLKERYISEHKYDTDEMHPTLKDLLDIAPKVVKYNNEARLAYFDEPDVNVHTKAIYQTIGDGGHVPAYVLKDYPDIAKDFDVDISDSAIAYEATVIDVNDRSRLVCMPKGEYDEIIDSVKVAYDTNTGHITDKMLAQDYEEELVDCKRSAKLRKKVFNNLPEHMQYGYTPETMDARLHKSMVTMAHRNNIEIPTEVRAGYPTIYTDMPFSYDTTGNEECDTAVNDILTQIRDKLKTDDSIDEHVKISHTVHEIIGAPGESVPMLFGMGIDSEVGTDIARGIITTMSAALISPGLMDQIKNFKNPTGRAMGMMTYEDGIRSYQSSGVMHLGNYDDKTVAHEYGHMIDWMLPEINELSQAFLNKRTEGDPLVLLSDIIPYGDYGPDEVTRPDNFMEAYIGKHYDHGSSEVLSMGMGYLTSSESMMDMYEQDPEYLGYIVAVLSGRARGTKVTKGTWSGSDEPANKSEIIEIDLYKLLNTTGLTQKRVLVRRKGEAPFWSTRWVQQGDSIKDTVEAAGYELVDESEDPDLKPVSTVADLVVAAYAAGEAAFARGLPNQFKSDSELEIIIKRNPGDIKDKLNILEGWSKGWGHANAVAPVPGVFDEPEPRKPTGFITVEDWGRVGTVKVKDLKPGDTEILDGGMERKVIALRTDRDAAVPSKTVIFGPFTGAPAEVGDTIVTLRDDYEVPLKEFVNTVEQPDNFDTMPEPEVGDKPKPDIQPDTPTIDRVTGTKSIAGWVGKKPAMKVSELQVGDIQLFNGGESLKISGIRRSGKSYILTYEDYIDESTGKPWETKKQGRGMVGVLIPDNFDTMPDPNPEPTKLTVLDVKIPAYKAGEDAFKRGVAATHGGDDPELLKILDSLSHLPDDEKFKVLENWLAGWTNAEAQTKNAPDIVTPEVEAKTTYGVPLADRLNKKISMEVPGVGIVPAIMVKDIQIGDLIQFPEGVYTVKGVIVKGASSIVIFHEKDNKGNDLKIKKQNRTSLAVEKTQLRPGGYEPMPEDSGRKLTPFWAMRDEKGEALKLIPTMGDFTPSKTIEDAFERLGNQFLKDKADIVELYRVKTDISLDGLTLPQMNSIIHGFERTIGKYNIKLDHIGWNEKKQSYAAMYTYLGAYRAILFQKTATKGQKAHQKRTIKNFNIGKDRHLTDYERYLSHDERYPGSHDDLKHRIAKLEKLNCWTVDSTLDDPILGLVVHEGHHAIYEQNKLKTAWYGNIKELVGPKLSEELKCATVSEYGMSEMGELFAEVGVAVEFGIEIDPDVKQAYIKTMETIK